MVLDIQTLIGLIVAIIVGVAVVICCVYYCSCKPGWANTRRRLVTRQIAQDEEANNREREASHDQLRETLTANKQTRDDIRNKYQLR
jgi:hypothetical protein